jgi:hypothetical protein
MNTYLRLLSSISEAGKTGPKRALSGTIIHLKFYHIYPQISRKFCGFVDKILTKNPCLTAGKMGNFAWGKPGIF